MKKFLTKYLGIPGLIIWWIFSTIVRVPVAVILLLSMAIALLIVSPLTQKDLCWPKWINRLYDWYVGQ